MSHGIALQDWDRKCDWSIWILLTFSVPHCGDCQVCSKIIYNNFFHVNLNGILLFEAYDASYPIEKLLKNIYNQKYQNTLKMEIVTFAMACLMYTSVRETVKKNCQDA